MRSFVMAFVGALALGACGGGSTSGGVNRCTLTSGCGTPADSGTRTTTSMGDAAVAPGPPAEAASHLLLSVDALSGSEATVVDARSASAFAAGHIPGARSLPVAQLSGEIEGVPGQVLPADEVARRLAMAGIAPEEPVVVYGARSDLAAARLFWILEYMGQARVQILDGGFEAFEDTGLPTETGTPEVESRAYPDDARIAERRVDAAWVLAHLDDPGTVLIDARSDAEYAAGHIPGARSFDWQRNLEGGQLRPLDELRALYADVPRDATLVAYCQTGSRAAMAYFTLRYLGYPDVRLYDGSMAGWTSDPSRPLE